MAIVNRSGNVFAAQVGAKVLRMKNYTKRVWQESCVRLVYEMQLPVDAGGRMPVVTGFLRASLMASTSPIAGGVLDKADNGPFLYFPNRIEDVIRSMKVGEKLHLAYLAVYANKIEFGWGGRPGYGFQRLAVQRWPAIVAEVLREQRAA